ncbi:MAG: hypothetical protein K9J37_09445 [Saprospiraceae bacterium]|nr:hypothetical protein [Saprospiraceae bacterium]MCF8250127.1 hypothetical protein [Saprospiraceae bacterium]MCF8279391.1 hypothetical protein [Bacteroidales bacterium]MCF8311181.1 hypothetical protein [Saprospiraceae bacterium]MCF8440438.1 hypothetical protein [Saprospiraceae bacterium]
MKNAVSTIATISGLLLATICQSHTTADTLAFQCILVDFQSETSVTAAFFQKKQASLAAKMEAVNLELSAHAGHNKRKFQKALDAKLRLMDAMTLLEEQSDVSMLRIRYRKGVDLIRVMYEKILGLDHHFTGLHTYQNISTLSNPNAYPEFEKAKEMIEKNKNKRYSLKLPALLETNPLVSGTFMLVGLLLGEGNQEVKEEEASKIACILDFTVRMNADLGIINNETEFLKNANQTLLEDCQRLFMDYGKAVGYHVSIEECRNTDDWETLFGKLDEKIAAIESGFSSGNGPVLASSKDLVNIEFATQRVSDFITKYSNFIGQGTQYYQKFDHIVNNYQNEDACQAQLPRQFAELKADISSTIDKFNNTYNLPEIQGSRLKDLMYGVGE